MISPALAQFDPAQPACSGEFAFLCALIVADQASIISIALSAYRRSCVTDHMSASVYAATASPVSSPQPRSGSESGPHSTVARGLAVQVNDACLLRRILSYADFHGSAPALTFDRARSSCPRVTRTPGCTNPDAAGSSARAFGAATVSVASRGPCCAP